RYPRAPIGFQLAGELQPCSQSIAQYRQATGTLGPWPEGKREWGGVAGKRS
ncbi:unnamed protein product, partial [Tetraodon nigroviridis]